MTWQISPFGNDQLLTSNGVLAVGYKLYTYLAGTTTKEAVAAAFDGLSFHTNPIVLNSIGMPPSPIYLDIDKSYKFVYATPTDTDPPASPIYTADNITVRNLSVTNSEWVTGTTPTYISANSFSITGDQRALYHVGRRVKLVAAGSTVYGVIASTAYASVTTVTVLVDDGLTISASLNTVYYGLLSAAGSSWPDGFNTGLKTTLNAIDARTNTVNNPLELNAQTTGTPASNIGTGILFRAESGDEAPSDFGQLDASASNVTAGLEQTFFRAWLRVAGAALTEVWRWAALGAFKGIFTHTNTADRTYTMPNRDTTVDAGDCYMGPASVAAGSTRSHEGSVVISSNQALSGVHYYTDFTLNAGVTITPTAASGGLVIVASNSITINGTIAANGTGVVGPAAGATSTPGVDATDQPGGTGGAANSAGPGGTGGRAMVNGVPVALAGTQVTGSLLRLIHHMLMAMGGASGGSGGTQTGTGGGTGGTGGGSIGLSAPSVILGATAVLNTSGVAGGNASTNGSGGGGGGAAGNIYVSARNYTDSGAIITQTGGPGGAFQATGSNGSAGQNGVKQINLYV